MVDTVYAIGGSVVNQNFDRLDELADALEKDEQVAVVVGAGHLKKHQEVVRENTTKAETDLVGIAATRLNAKTLEALMEDAYPGIPETVEEVRKAAASGKSVVMGGLNPGFSTDAVAAVVAEVFGADLYIITDVDGIYTGDPGTDSEAEKLEEIEVDRLLRMTEGKSEPGTYAIVDETAVNIIGRSGIKTRVFEGTVENVEDPEEARGTEIVVD